MRMPTSDEVNSALRHVYSATGAAASVLVVVGLSQGDATTLGLAVHEIGDGVAKVIAGVTALIPVVSALYAAWSASPFSRMLKNNADPELKKVEAIPGTRAAEMAEKIPGDKVVVAEPPAAPAAKK